MRSAGVTVFLGLGSNLGRRADNLRCALHRLSFHQVTIGQVSSLYESAPWGVADQPSYLNAVAAAVTGHTPEGLLTACKAVERACGRTEGPRWGPRAVDVDILLYGRETLSSARLVIPHRHLKERGFVLVPLAEIAPGLILPDGDHIADLAAAADTRDVHWIEGPGWAAGAPSPAGT